MTLTDVLATLSSDERAFPQPEQKSSSLDSEDDFHSGCQSISVISNSPSQEEYTCPDNRTSIYCYNTTPGLKPFRASLINGALCLLNSYRKVIILLDEVQTFFRGFQCNLESGSSEVCLNLKVIFSRGYLPYIVGIDMP